MAHFLKTPDKRQLRLTRLANYVANQLEASSKPVITDYELFLITREIYEVSSGLYLRKPQADKGDHSRLRNALLRGRILDRDRDYPRVYRVSAIPDKSADEIACLVDPHCYLSHLSAIQRYGFSERRPNQLILTVPVSKLARQLLRERASNDLKEELDSPDVLLPTIVHHPKIVRMRHILTVGTSQLGRPTDIKGTFGRVSNIGRTFFDMVHRPDLCGGMQHVIDIWQERAKEYLDDIILSIEDEASPIAFVRAGYILEEILDIRDPRIVAWRKYAQRGGSRVLDPANPYVPVWSEKWMISLNV